MSYPPPPLPPQPPPSGYPPPPNFGYPPPPPLPPRRDNSLFAGLTIAFSALTAISLLVTLLVGNNASQCNSGLGQFAQAFDQQAAGQCSVVNTAHAILIFATVVLGIVSLGFLAATIDRIRR